MAKKDDLIRKHAGSINKAAETGAVAAGLGRAFATTTDAIWIAHYGEVAGDLAAGTLRELPVDTSDTFGPLGLIVRSGVSLSLGAELMMAALREVAAEVRAEGER